MHAASRRPGESAEVTVVIPARNEAERIAATVAAARSLPGVRRVLVVDDGSDDATAARAAEAGGAVIRLPRSVGKGGAVRTGLREACPPGAGQGEIVLLLDGDLGASAARAGKLIAPVASGQADMTVAVFPPARRRGGFGLAVGLARAAIGALAWRRMQAPLSGQRAVRRSLLEQMRPEQGFGLEVGLTLDALALGARLVEVPVEMTHAETGRSLAGFRHRGRQFFSALGAALRRLFWPLGPTGRPAGRARMVAWAATLFALFLILGWTLRPTVEVLFALLCAWCAVIGAVIIADRLGWERENYQGRQVLSSVGICFTLAGLPHLAFYLLGAPDFDVYWLWLPAALSVVMCGVGLLDDLRGSREVRGFAGHLRAVTEARITTGLVKIIVGGGACVAAGCLYANLAARTGEWRAWPGLLDGVLIALCANAINLLDLRPGRALKGFWVLCAVALIVHHTPAAIMAGAVLICSIIYAPLDFRARAMMGDAGSNVLGAAAGLALVATLPIEGRIVVVAALVALHVYAEFGSLSSLIERNPALRCLDALGRSGEGAS